MLKRVTPTKLPVRGLAGNEATGAIVAVTRIAAITPYMPPGDDQVRGFFDDYGYEVVRLKGLKCGGPVVIAHVSAAELRGEAPHAGHRTEHVDRRRGGALA